jgi:hypothetical protein
MAWNHYASDEKVKHDLTIRRQKFAELRELARMIPPKGFEYDEGNHFAFMCSIFLEHSFSVLCLIGFPFIGKIQVKASYQAADSQYQESVVRIPLVCQPPICVPQNFPADEPWVPFLPDNSI